MAFELIETLISSVPEFSKEFGQSQVDKCFFARAEIADSFELSIPLIKKLIKKVTIPNLPINVVAHFRNQAANAASLVYWPAPRAPAPAVAGPRGGTAEQRL